MSTGMGSLLTAIAGLVAGLTTHIPRWFKRDDGPDRVVAAIESLGKTIIEDNCETRELLRAHTQELQKHLIELREHTVVLMDRNHRGV